MMKIAFYTETNGYVDYIHTIENATSNPFKKGDIFYFSVEMLTYRTENEIRKSEPRVANMIINFRKQREKDFHIKQYKIISKPFFRLKEDYNKDIISVLSIEYQIKEYQSIPSRIKHLLFKIKNL